jgi:LAGLIDADG endonuclease
MFSTLVLFFSTCNNLVNSGNQQERLVDNSNFYSEAKYSFLGGFAEGEGSVSASVKVHSDFRFGVNVQPEFGVTQHENGKHILAEFKDLFDGKGNLHLKPGSQDVWEYNLSGLTNLIDHVVPFYLKYVIPFSGKVKEFNTFLEILERKQRKEHFIQEGLIDMVKLAYTLNTEGKGKMRKRTLEEVLAIIRDKKAYFNPNN